MNLFLDTHDKDDFVKFILDKEINLYKKSVNENKPALEICQNRARFIDELIISLYDLAHKKYLKENSKPQYPITIFATGGYARNEMGLYSDIDIMFLYEGEPDTYLREITDFVLYPFWDNNIEINSTIRSIKECIKVGQQDVRTLTALIESRYICGDNLQVSALNNAIANNLRKNRELKNFINKKLLEKKERYKKSGDFINLLEPLVKEGKGGLRDFHTFLWIAKACFFDSYNQDIFDIIKFNPQRKKDLFNSVGFLWQIRHKLHILSNNSKDRLGRDEQRILSSPFSSTEELMYNYYNSANNIYINSNLGIEKAIEIRFKKNWIWIYFNTKKIDKNINVIKNKIGFIKPDTKPKEIDILNIFKYINLYNKELSVQTKDLIKNQVDAINFDNFKNREIRIIWKEIFAAPKFLHNTIKEMLETKCFTKWFPEAIQIINRIQHNTYHFYTIDTHSILALKELSYLLSEKSKKEFQVVFQAKQYITKLHVLSFVTLFHDLGKTRGENHEKIGADLAKEISKRIGWSDDEANLISLLIKNHILMPRLAFRRDIKDNNLIERFSEIVKSPEILSMLYLLAISDVRSIGPNMWSDWKGGLLTELYVNTLSFLQGKRSLAQKQKIIQSKLKKVYRKLDKQVSYETLDSFLSSMPDRYLMNSSTSSIASHFLMTNMLSKKRVIIESRHRKSRGVTELTIVTKDAPGLFSKIAGVLSINEVNIIDAQLFTFSDGIALDHLWITDFSNKSLMENKRLEFISNELEEVLDGKKDIHSLIKKISIPGFLEKGRKKIESKIEIDNDVSLDETVVDIYTNDRLGLLYDVSHAFFKLDCIIERAKITTYLKQVIDIFYIHDIKGNKITSREKLKQINDTIMGVL